LARSSSLEVYRLRIISGKHRGRHIQAPAQGVRPTADRARQAVFNILEHGVAWPGFSDCGVLDLFAGTGAYGLEALSRGAARATFIDSDPAALLGIRRNAAALGEARSIVLLKLDASRLPPPARIVEAPCGLAFLDPSYESRLAVPALQGAASHGWIGSGAIAVVEVGAREPLAPPPGYVVEDERIYGAARILFLRFR
jgi:16S rRNA (guanine966-N2)-methyltransferase